MTKSAIAALGPALLLSLAIAPAAALAQAPRDGLAADLPGDGGVLVVGDSLEVLTKPYLQRHLPGVPLTHNAVGGYNSNQIFDLFEESYKPSQSVIVFDAGTNDNPNYPQIVAGNLDAVTKRIGDRCMVVPTIHGLSVGGVGNGGKNRAVRAFAESRPGTQTPNWARVAATRSDLMQPDDLHPTPEGADRRARLIAEGVQACLAGTGIGAGPGGGGPSAAERELDRATERWRALGREARAAGGRASRAGDEVRGVRGALVAGRDAAAAEVAELEADHARRVEDYAKRKEIAIGLALGLVALIVIALAWPQIRGSRPIGWLAGKSILVALPAILGVMVLLGLSAALLIGGQGWSRTAGVALAVTTPGLGIAALVGRHSIRVERGTRKTLLGGTGSPRWTRYAVAALMGALCVAAGVDGLTRTGPEPPVIADAVRKAAVYSQGDPAEPPTSELVVARKKAASLRIRARRLRAKLRAAGADVARAERKFARSSGGS